MKPVAPILVLALLGAVIIATAATLEVQRLNQTTVQPGAGAFKKLLGDGRRLFAGQFVEMADVYLHSGFYPSIFDRRGAAATKAVVSGAAAGADHHAHEHDEHGKCLAVTNHDEHEHDEHGHCAHDHGAAGETEHEREMNFLGPPRDWLEGFIRKFRITKHTHLQQGEAKEILPWLRVAMELDPHAIETYTATAYWLRRELKRPELAEEVLREGIRNNPRNPELLLELGRLYHDDYEQDERARNLWLGALKLWQEQGEAQRDAGARLLGDIAIHLAHLEREHENWAAVLLYLELARVVSPNPEAIQKQIDEIRSKNSAPAQTLPPSP
jgi:tetratricopeptide (TPR) repeat protein